MILIASMLGILIPLNSQEADSILNQAYKAKIFEFTFDPIIPVYNFGRDLDQTLFGLTAAYYWERNKQDYSFWGVQMNWAHIDSDRNTYFNGVEEVEDLTSSNFFGAQFMLRYYPDFFFWRIEPFAELSFGSNFFTTTTTRYYFDEDNSSDFDFNEFDFALSYGLGIGFTTQIVQQFFLVTKCSFYGGNTVTYQYQDGEDEIVPLDNFRNETSQTNYIRFQVGISFTFL
ncbi:MAG: autotransporter outer membrane beta-barrel domain-containing protein [Saprospiraceae bacterium]|nr:autotransporter outer membrane beta-barrel domain-containing protein [Saprospiraceae bacterium]